MTATSRLADALAPVFAGDTEQAWESFLSEFAPVVLQVVHLFERDPDTIEDCFLFVCEHLRRDELRRLRRFRSEGPASFPTWLRVVVRHLCLDWRRARFGRLRLPRSIARLPPLDQEVFRCVHLRGLSENEAFHAVRAVAPALTREQLADSIIRIGRALSSRQAWALLTRRPRLESLTASSRDDPSPRPPLDPADPRADPEHDAERGESLAALAAALGHLAPCDRLLVRLRYEQDLTLEQIARVTGVGSAATVERTLQHALARLRDELRVQGFADLSVEGE